MTDLAGRSVAIPAGADSFACIGPGCLRLYCYVAEKSQLAGIEDVEKTWGQAGRPYAMALGDVEGLAAIGPGGPGSAPDAERLLASGAEVVFSTYAMEPAEIQELQEKISIPVVALRYGGGQPLLGGGRPVFGPDRTDYRQGGAGPGSGELLRPGQGRFGEPGCRGPGPAHGIPGLPVLPGQPRHREHHRGLPHLRRAARQDVVEEAGIDGYVILDKEKLLEMDPDFLIIDGGGLSRLAGGLRDEPGFLRVPFGCKAGGRVLAAAV